METTRRDFVGMGVAVAATTSELGRSAIAGTNSLAMPNDRFWIAAVTPVDSSLNFDSGAYREMLAYWKASGADGVLVLGTTGEGQSFSIAERKKIAEFSVKNKNDLDIIVGTGTSNFPDTIDLSLHAAANGADSVLIVPPYYAKNPKGDGVVRYFAKVFDKVKTPIRYYHIPKTTGVPVDISVFRALKQYPNFVGVKDSNGDAAEFEAITGALENLNVATGTDNLVESSLGHGNGAILASGNLFTKQVAVVFAAHRAGQDLKAPLEKLKTAQALFQGEGYGTGGAATKYALSVILGTRQTFVRPPADEELTDDQKSKIVAGVDRLKAIG